MPLDLHLQLLLGFLQQQEVAEQKRNAQMEQEHRQLLTSAKSESMKGEDYVPPGVLTAAQLSAACYRDTLTEPVCWRVTLLARSVVKPGAFHQLRLCLAGHWDFEQRLRANIESEKMSAAQQRASKREARERLAASARHRRNDSSASTTLTSPGAAVSLLYNLRIPTEPQVCKCWPPPAAALTSEQPGAKRSGARFDCWWRACLRRTRVCRQATVATHQQPRPRQAQPLGAPLLRCSWQQSRTRGRRHQRPTCRCTRGVAAHASQLLS